MAVEELILRENISSFFSSIKIIKLTFVSFKSFLSYLLITFAFVLFFLGGSGNMATYVIVTSVAVNLCYNFLT